ncbi:sensor histidine kinase [Actinomadura roseirufa]|uniref:sensor histidine kinase n=1 Tax=Actinomadura roseirufa TaxID=2094049 RepID=UPI001041BC9B|nr:nitrate- and nitrite sensing domain-containing protein [Actinomadura roseirufa]
MRLRRSPARRDRPRNIRLRSRIVFMLGSLVALWVFAAWVTTQEGYTLLQTGKRDSTAGRPTKTLINQLQDERRISLVYLGGRRHGADGTSLREQRARTDRTVAQWRRSAHKAPGDKIKRYVRATTRQLEGLASVRASIDAGTIARDAAAGSYNDTIDAAFLITTATAEVDDAGIAADARSLIALTRSREMLAREDAELSGVLAEGRFGPGDLTRFAQSVALRNAAEKETVPQLPDSDRGRVEALQRGTDYAALQAAEKRALQPRPQGRPTLTAPQWQATTQPLMSQLDHMIDLGGDEVLERAKPLGYILLLKWLGAALLGAIAVSASVALAITSARQLLQQLNRLRDAAQNLAEQRLPLVMDRLTAGDSVDLAVEAPPLEFGTDEIGQVGRAFNAVQHAAVTAAAGQAAQREATRRILLHLGQRNRVLLGRQIKLIDTMEKREDLDLAQLKELFTLDQLTVQGQRYVNNLVLLAGGLTTHGARRPMPMIDVVRAAIGQVESYQRVRISHVGNDHLVGYAVEDVVSLLAELIDNAVTYSPHSVDVESQVTASGIAVTIDDRGLGIEDAELDRINAFLAAPPEFLDSAFDDAPQLGHFVVATRARKHDLTVTLRRSAWGGVTAVVLIPAKLFVDPGSEPRDVTRQSSTGTGGTPAPVAASAEAGVPAPAGNLALLHRDRPAARTLTSVPTSVPEPARVSGTSPVPMPVTAQSGRGDEPAGEIAPEPAAEPAETPGGLPIRKPQESLVEALRTSEPVIEQDPEPSEGRSPEEVKRIMGSYQAGTQRARLDAIAQEDPPAPAAPSDEPGDAPPSGGTDR